MPERLLLFERRMAANATGPSVVTLSAEIGAPDPQADPQTVVILPPVGREVAA